MTDLCAAGAVTERASLATLELRGSPPFALQLCLPAGLVVRAWVDRLLVGGSRVPVASSSAVAVERSVSPRNLSLVNSRGSSVQRATARLAGASSTKRQSGHVNADQPTHAA